MNTYALHCNRRTRTQAQVVDRGEGGIGIKRGAKVRMRNEEKKEEGAVVVTINLPEESAQEQAKILLACSVLRVLRLLLPREFSRKIALCNRSPQP